MNHRDLNQRLAVARQDFIIFRMAPKIHQPGKGTLDDPAARQHGKAGRRFGHHLQVDFVAVLQSGDPCSNRFATITAVDPQLFEPLDPAGKIGAQQAAQAVAIIAIGGGNQDSHHQPDGIDQHMPLASMDLFARIIALFFALGCRLDTLRIDTASRRGGLPALAQALLPGQRIHHRLPSPLSAPGIEVAIHGFPLTKFGRQHPPLTAGFGHIQNAIDHLPSRTRRSTGATGPPCARRQQWVKDLPLRLGQIRRIFDVRTHWMPFVSGCLVAPEFGLVSTLFLTPFYKIGPF